MKSLHVYQRYLSFISNSSTYVPLELYDRITWSFAYWPSWYNDMWDMIFLIQRLGESYFENGKVRQLSFMLNLAKSYLEPYICMIQFWAHIAIFYILSLIKHHCLLRHVIHSSTLVIHIHIHRTKSIKCGSQVDLHPPERKRKWVRNHLARVKKERGTMKEARVQHHSRTFSLHTHLHLTKVYGWHDLSETSCLILQHRWKRYAFIYPYLKLQIQLF
jgi:hypothetical protein